MTGQEAVRNLHEAIDDTTIFYYDAPREAAHAALAALVAERDALKEAAEEWEQYEREGTAEWQRIVAKHRENTAQAVAERDRYRDAMEILVSPRTLMSRDQMREAIRAALAVSTP